VVVTIASWLAALIGVGIIVIGVRFLVVPQVSAKGYGVPSPASAYLSVKGVRDIASGLAVFAVMAGGDHHTLGWLILAETFTAAGDAAIVLRNGGTRAVAYGVHGATAAVMVAIAAVLILL
jgi:hypothetical protein